MRSQLTKARLKKFLSYYRPYRRIFAMDMAFAALSAVAVLLFPLVSGYIIDVVLSSWDEQARRALLIAGLFLLGLTIVKVVSNVIYGYYGHAMGAKMERNMREELFAHYESLSFGFHARNSVGKLMTVLSNDLTGMTELFHHGPEDIMMTLIKFVGAFFILLRINLPLTCIVFSVLPILCVISIRADKIMERSLIRNRKQLSDMNEHLEDTLSGIRTVKAFGSEQMEAERFAGKNQAYTDGKCHFYKVEALFYETMESYPQLLTMLTVLFGALLMGRGSLDLPVLVTFLLYVGSLAEPVRTMLNFMRLFEEGKAGFVRFMDMIETKPTVTQRHGAAELSRVKGDIAFEGVSFHYGDSGENVLEGIDLTIASGESVAFAGASGIGKTTIAALMARFYDVTAGKITIDGVDIRDITTSSLRDAVGIVQQEVYIFNGTIRDNICYGSGGVSEQEVIRAAKRANIHEFIVSLERGYDSIVGTRGIMLSGGQRQRISIARLFLKNPKILILDEATSALDYESEVIVQASIEELMKNRTCITIAHRLSTIRSADRIYVLADKRIIEQGSHEQLMAMQGEYAKLCSFGTL